MAWTMIQKPSKRQTFSVLIEYDHRKNDNARIFHSLQERKKKSNWLTVFWNLLFHKIKNLYFWKAFLDKKGKPPHCPQGVSLARPGGRVLADYKRLLQLGRGIEAMLLFARPHQSGRRMIDVAVFTVCLLEHCIHISATGRGMNGKHTWKTVIRAVGSWRSHLPLVMMGP